MGVDILIIETERSQRQVWAAALQRTGYTVVHTGNPERGEELLERENPRLVLLGLFLTGISGLDLLENMKKNQPQLKIVMISSLGFEDVVLQAIQAGAADFLVKPVDSDSLVEKIHRLLD